jgi:hypothetical protein
MSMHSMIIWCGDIDIKQKFLEIFWSPIYFLAWILGFSLLNILFIESNNLEVHLSNSRSP